MDGEFFLNASLNIHNFKENWIEHSAKNCKGYDYLSY
jgi:hypothetical protein